MYSLPSTVRILHRKCPDCREKHLIDPANLNDYAETVEGFVQQSWCPCCGLMAPNLREDENYITDTETISNHKKKKIIRLLSDKHGFDYHVSSRIEKDLKTISLKKEFIMTLSEMSSVFFKTMVSESEIKSFI